MGLSFHLMRSYRRKRWKKLFRATGDGDFHEVVPHLVEDENVSLVLVGSIDTVSEDLRPCASAVIAEHTVLHQVITLHLEAFLEAVAEAGDGGGLPQFVKREFREFLLRGVFEGGSAVTDCVYPS